MTEVPLIEFKSLPENWKKEQLGIKPNTIRTFDSKEENDERQQLLWAFVEGRINLLKIELTNTHTNESFVRDVVDVSRWQGFFIISWKE